jgi:hypothetical protein
MSAPEVRADIRLWSNPGIVFLRGPTCLQLCVRSWPYFTIEELIPTHRQSAWNKVALPP